MVKKSENIRTVCTYADRLTAQLWSAVCPLVGS